MTTSMLNVPLDNGGGGEFRIQVVNLPDGYTLKSITYGSSELSDGVVAISRSNLWIPSSRSSALTSLSNFGPVFVRAESRESVSIHLARVDSRLPAKAGARVSGKSRYFGYRAVYISGVPGTAFTDGSFEFRGVPPGRHTIVSVDDSGPTYPLGASVVVGSGDIHDVTLEVSSALPFDIGVPMPPSPVEGHSSGVAIPLATLDVAIVDEAIREWIPGGTLVISSRTRAGYSLRGPEGRFEIHGLFPGAYDLEFLLSGYSPVRQSVVVGDDDIHLEFALHPIVP